MTGMVERVARAISKANGDPPDDWMEDGYNLVAYAAIEAMREPNTQMNNAGYPYVRGYEDMRSPYACWQAMIDAALAET